MPTLNPDFRSADDVIVPADPQFGWAYDNLDEADLHSKEQYAIDKLYDDMPVACKATSAATVLPEMQKAWDKFQADRGRFPGSFDWTLLDEFAIGGPLHWLPQIIGSCVASNTFPGVVDRMIYQVALLGEPHEYFGKNEFGQNNLAFYAPYTYGAARKRGNMLGGGDGLYCEVMAESMLKDGFLLCNTPALVSICQSANLAKDKDFPEPQSASFYRQWGAGKHLSAVAKYADYRMMSSEVIKSTADLDRAIEAGSPCFHCSGIAVKKVGTHKDGFAIHGRNPADSWAHNMRHAGYFIASDGEKFYRFANTSWGVDVIYNIPVREADDWFARRRVTCMSIGPIDAPKSAPMVA